MPKLTTADMKLIDNLFGMYGGYVMDFSNSRFDALFKRDIGIDISSSAYAIHGTSKGKRLWGFAGGCAECGDRHGVARPLGIPRSRSSGSRRD